MIRFLALLLILPLVLSTPESAYAQDSNVVQDSVYFTLDDGVMSPEEMEQESMYVYGLCSGNPYQRVYFNCECLAGAFLLQREKSGPTVLQNDILEQLTRSDKATCANTETIAGTSYESCMAYATNYLELRTDNEQYCTCVGNKVANDLTKHPALDVTYIENVSINAMSFCNDTKNRKTASKARDPRSVN